MIHSPIAIAVSGGRDSLLALALLRESGREVLALHGLLTPGEPDARRIAGLQAQCDRLGARLEIVDLRPEFERLVIQPFVAAYVAGQTPNPCALCNPRIKFGLLADTARRLGAQSLATGHYARMVEHPEYGPALAQGADQTKDQSYFLALVPRDRLAMESFPLGEWRKAEVLPALQRRGLHPPEEAESQEICFVPGDDYPAFMEARRARLPGDGPIRLRDGREVGRHAGLWRHTQGQRRGLGVAWSEPLYVLDKDVAANALVVGPKADAFTAGTMAGQLNVLVDPALWPRQVLAKGRYRQPLVPAAWKLRDGRLDLAWSRPVDRPAPGQILAVYDDQGVVLAGGVIETC